MNIFTINADLNVAAYATEEQANAACAQAEANGERTLVFANYGIDSALRTLNIKPEALWNSLPGVTPVNKFQSRATGIARLLKQLDRLEVTPVEEPKAEQPEAKPARKRGPKTTATNDGEPKAPRPGTKKALVIEMLTGRPSVTRTEICNATGWNAAFVDGFIAWTVKKIMQIPATYTKTENGDRIYTVAAAQPAE